MGRKVFIGIEIEGAGLAHPLRGPIDDAASLKLLNSLASRRKQTPSTKNQTRERSQAQNEEN